MSIWVIFFLLQSFLYLQLPPNSRAQEWSLLDATVHQFPASEFESPPHRRRNHAWTPSPSRDLNNGNVHQQHHHHQQQQQQNIQFTNAKELQKKVKRPPSFANSNSREPLSVKLGFYLESLGDFRETQMSFEVDLYMYMSWRDSSLRHAGPDMVMINEDLVRRQLWVPDLYFANARQANFHEVTVPNFNLFISPDGTVAYSSRVTLTVACNLDLVDYPMDYQQCHIRVLSYAYIAKIVNVTWFRQSPIMYNPDIDLPEFEIDRIGAEYCDGTYRYAVTDRSSKTDRFSCLMGNLYLRRRIGFNMVQSYIPTGLIVIISWVSFWIDRRAVPARVTLSFTTLLTMTTIGNGMRFALPRVSYAKAIDFWFGGCMLFVFLALVEFALVNSYMRRSEKYERLAGKYKRRTSTTDLLTLSPILASELARSYVEMLKLRRKSSAFHLLDGVKKNFTSSPVLNKRKLAKESRDETSQSLSEDVSEQSKEKKSKKNGEEAEKKISMQENPAGIGKKAPAGQPAGNLNMDSSYYDNMHLSVNGHKKTLEQLPNGTVKRKVTPVKANSVVFAVDDADKAEEEEDEYLWPKVAEDGSKSNGELPEGKRSRVEPNPELYCKYLEASQLLSRRALNIDKASRILFPISFVLFNILYWGYYLVLRQRRIV